MALLEHTRGPDVAARPTTRYAYADTLKVLLVTGVIAGHVTMSWIDIDAWVFDEPPVREPLLTLLKLLAVLGVMFAMALFFMIAGAFTPRSFARKGPRRFLVGRSVRLGLPVLFYVFFLAPVVAYHDEQDWAGWNRGFPAFTRHMWLHPELGAAWFLVVLLLFSIGYAAVRTLLPRRAVPDGSRLRFRHLVVAVVLIATASFVIRTQVPFGEEHWQMAVGQAPAWVAGFVMGVLGSERGWFEHFSPALSRRLFRVTWIAALMIAAVFGIASLGGDGTIDRLAGGFTWWALAVVVVEAPFVVAMSLWLYDVARRRVHGQGGLMRELSRGAFAAYIGHEVVAVYAVVATQHVALPREVEWIGATTLAVVGSFAVASVLVRLPGVRRVVGAT